MRRLLLLLILALFGAMIYFMYSASLIYWQFIPAMAIVLVLYYISSSVITEKMVKKAIGNSDFFMVKGNISSKDEKELIAGALIVTASEIMFCRRKSAFGGIEALWKNRADSLEEYTIGKIDDFHNGIILKFRDGVTMKVGSKEIAGKEALFRVAAGWPAE